MTIHHRRDRNRKTYSERRGYAIAHYDERHPRYGYRHLLDEPPRTRKFLNALPPSEERLEGVTPAEIKKALRETGLEKGQVLTRAMADLQLWKI